MMKELVCTRHGTKKKKERRQKQMMRSSKGIIEVVISLELETGNQDTATAIGGNGPLKTV